MFDTFEIVRSEDHGIDRILSSDAAGRVAVYSWNMHPQLVDDTSSKGCSGYVRKGRDGKELVEVLERMHGGEVVVSTETDDRNDGRKAIDEKSEVSWPGKGEGLNPRESQGRVSAKIMTAYQQRN